jgi:hypothetical protein
VQRSTAEADIKTHTDNNKGITGNKETIFEGETMQNEISDIDRLHDEVQQWARNGQDSFTALEVASFTLEKITAERHRREELEVVAAALYLGHDDAKHQFDMYRTVYLNPTGGITPE